MSRMKVAQILVLSLIFLVPSAFAEQLQGIDGTSCNDSDGNGAYTTKGTCTDNSGIHTDFCDGNTAKDYYCTGSWNGTHWSNVKCEAGGYGCGTYVCSDGACIIPKTTTTTATTTTFSTTTSITTTTQPQCPTSYTCLGTTVSCAPCQSGQYSKPKYDDEGCVIGYECMSENITCPEISSTISCPSGQQLTKTTDNRGCVVGYNCISVATKPLCPTYADLQSIENKCIAQGGKVATFTDANGCKFVDCKFHQDEVSPDPITGFTQCSSDKEIDDGVRACKSTGLFPAISFEGGCKVVKCIQQHEERCKIPTPEERLQLDNQCSAKGLPVVKDVDPNGCAFIRCGETKQETCAKEVPPEAFTKCQSIGGEMIVKKDFGCVVYANCITRGDERTAYVEPVNEVPDSTELLQIALKLEQLKIELTKLSDQAKDIATFYAGRADADEERFKRVSSMFGSTASRIDDIKNKIKQKLNSLTKEDMLEIKHDIKRLKEVTIKDILYMMLSNSKDVNETIKDSKEISAKTAKIEDVEKIGDNCGTDSVCFDRAFRVCKPVTFRPESINGPIMTVVGLDGDFCVVKAKLPENQGPPAGSIPGTNPPYEMTCKFKEYSFGISGPQQFTENCQGSMVQLMKQFGGFGAVTGTVKFPPSEGGPGGCKSVKECAQYCLNSYDDCVKWMKGHPAYGTSPPSKETLQKIVSGETSGEFQSRGGLGFEGPSGCKSPEECSKVCNNNPQLCAKWCSEHPDICQQGGKPVPVTATKPSAVQACVGCLNNGVCDIGECSECVDCLNAGRVIK